jgi:ADP-heptose:LPS heptosyltransferase
MPRLGDGIMMTCAVRDLKSSFPDWKIHVSMPSPQIFENNPHIEYDGIVIPDKAIKIGPTTLTKAARKNGLHFANAFRWAIQEQLNISIKQGPLKGEIFLTEKEKANRVIDGKYWIIFTDHGPGMSSKEWVPDRWQKVVDSLLEITFVQMGVTVNSVELSGKNVINFMNKTFLPNTGTRELFSMIYNCEGIICLISGPMHIAGALNKPCVVIAGAREPLTYVKYQNHRFLENVGCLPCCPEFSCWTASSGRCFRNYFNAISTEKKKKLIKNEYVPMVNGNLSIKDYFNKYLNQKWVAPCLEMVSVYDVVKSVDSYYEGGLLEKKITGTAKVKKIFRMVVTARALGGAERSWLNIMNQAVEKGYRVELVAYRGTICKEIENMIPLEVRLTGFELSDPCEIMLFYASDSIWDFHKPEFEVFNRLQAKKKVMALTYKIGRAGQVEWSKDWEYLFLSSSLRDAFLKTRLPDVKTTILPPPVDLTEFFDIKPNYDGPLKISRTSTQGDIKFADNVQEIVRQCKANFSFMPPPTNLPDFDNVEKRRYNEIPVKEFLANSNCFWYLLSHDWAEQGPRIIMEAMAAGLPVIAENRDGPIDRVPENCGWLVDDHFEAIDIINNLSPEILREKGTNARNFAKENFKPENWINEIIK